MIHAPEHVAPASRLASTCLARIMLLLSMGKIPKVGVAACSPERTRTLQTFAKKQLAGWSVDFVVYSARGSEQGLSAIPPNRRGPTQCSLSPLSKTSDTPPLLFNSHSRHLLALDPEDLTTLDSLWGGNYLDQSSAIEEHLDILVSQGFVVSQDRDERTEVLESLDALTRDNGLATLTIMTTLQCNLGCGYCFQKRESSYLSMDTARAIVDRYGPLSETHQSMFVTWFGGEPLLNLEPIRYISRELQKRFNTYRAEMITNGVFLTADLAREMRSLGVEKVQITLDGPKEFHDARRPTRGGGSTYDKIRQNAIDASEIVAVHLRVNTDEELVADPNTLAQFMADMERDSQGRVGVYLSPVIGIGGRDNTLEHAYRSKEDYSQKVERVFMCARELGYRGHLPWVTKASGCTALNPMGHVIAPNGDQYRCWEEPGGPNEQRDGHVRSTSQTADERKVENQYLSFKEWHSDKCRTCRFQPVCGSGCPRSTVSENRFGKESEICAHTYSWIPMVVRMNYRVARERNMLVNPMEA